MERRFWLLERSFRRIAVIVTGDIGASREPAIDPDGFFYLAPRPRSSSGVSREPLGSPDSSCASSWTDRTGRYAGPRKGSTDTHLTL